MRKVPSVIELEVKDPVPVMERISVPRVWNRINSGFRIQDLTDDLFSSTLDLVERCCLVVHITTVVTVWTDDLRARDDIPRYLVVYPLQRYNLSGEPLARATGIRYDPDARAEYLDLINFWMRDRNSLVAVEEGTGRVVGVLVGRIIRKLNRTRTMSRLSEDEATAIKIEESEVGERVSGEEKSATLKETASEESSMEVQIMRTERLPQKKYPEERERIFYSDTVSTSDEEEMVAQRVEKFFAEMEELVSYQPHGKTVEQSPELVAMRLEQRMRDIERRVDPWSWVGGECGEEAGPEEWDSPFWYPEEWYDEEAEQEEDEPVAEEQKGEDFGWEVLDGTEGRETDGSSRGGYAMLEELKKEYADLQPRSICRVYALYNRIPDTKNLDEKEVIVQKQRKKNKREAEEQGPSSQPSGFQLSDGEPGRVYGNEIVRSIQAVRSHLMNSVNMYTKYNVDAYYKIYIISIATEYIKEPIALGLMRAAIEMARAMDVGLVTGVFTSAITQSLAKFMGFWVDAEVSYDEWRTLKDERDLFGDTGRMNPTGALMTVTLGPEKVPAVEEPTEPTTNEEPPRRKPKKKKNKK
ncbi:hypothetical protein AAG570_004971 [Ranatra chinensis]|uniref:Uncharacterized protein n=1 Tax=Ranatra chinensis TaxID=642074 RepID=A0ABD0XZ31_9HEMI